MDTLYWVLLALILGSVGNHPLAQMSQHSMRSTANGGRSHRIDRRRFSQCH